jgi:hypothetical protein
MKNTIKSFIAIVFAFIMQIHLQAQTPASPANWLFPNGNPESTRSQFWSSSITQSVDSMVLKWSTTDISGDIQPLIGNIKNNPKILPSFLWSPNEIIALVKDHIVVVDGAGKVLTKTRMPAYMKFLGGVTTLFDTNAAQPQLNTTDPVIFGISTIESANPQDSSVYCYLAGYSTTKDSIVVIKRLSVNLGLYSPNIYGGVMPFMGRRRGGETVVYATLSSSRPTYTPPVLLGQIPFFRGLTQFNTATVATTFPLPDSRDDIASRITLGPSVNFSQPSFSSVAGTLGVLLPVLPDTAIPDQIFNPAMAPTAGNVPYLLGLNVAGAQPSAAFQPQDLSLLIDTNKRPLIRPYYVRMTDGGGNNTETSYILVAEEYSGASGSSGRARLHLYDAGGVALTNPLFLNAPPITGGRNHYWSIASGDVDGLAANELLPYYPNNRGNEIVVTQSSKEFAYPGSMLYILRLRSGVPIPKISPAGTTLNQFDTIVSHRINGYVAAVNDLDAAPDGKSEIVLIDRSDVIILRMRDYKDERLRFGEAFDTLRIFSFPGEVITALEIADLEGDGSNDIVITTMNRTYVYGRKLPGTLQVLDPKLQAVPPAAYCAGDSLPLRWSNLLRGDENVHIFFRHYIDTVPQSRVDTIALNVANTADTMTYLFAADTTHYGWKGRFIIRNASSRDITDSTAIVSFPRPRISVDYPTTDSAVYVAQLFTIVGPAPCLDTVHVDMYMDSAWVRTSSVAVTGGMYYAQMAAPCMKYFACDTADKDSVLRFRIYGTDTKTGIRDTLNTYRLRLRPAPLTVNVSGPPAVAYPARTVSWNPLSLPPGIVCDTLDVLVSLDSGRTFKLTDRVAFRDGSFNWDVPINLRDSSALLRLCCASGCFRADTLVKNIVVRYINVVAPNPFNPPAESVGVIYSVPTATNVTITILDQANRVVARPVDNQFRAAGTAYSDLWDGSTSRGYAANGMYYLVLETSSGLREVYQIFVRKR